MLSWKKERNANRFKNHPFQQALINSQQVTVTHTTEGPWGLDVPQCPHDPPAPSPLREDFSFLQPSVSPAIRVRSKGGPARPPKSVRVSLQGKANYCRISMLGQRSELCSFNANFIPCLPAREETFLFMTEVKVPGSLNSLAPNVCPRHRDKTLVPSGCFSTPCIS